LLLSMALLLAVVTLAVGGVAYCEVGVMFAVVVVYVGSCGVVACCVGGGAAVAVYVVTVLWWCCWCVVCVVDVDVGVCDDYAGVAVVAGVGVADVWCRVVGDIDIGGVCCVVAGVGCACDVVDVDGVGVDVVVVRSVLLYLYWCCGSCVCRCCRWRCHLRWCGSGGRRGLPMMVRPLLLR